MIDWALIACAIKLSIPRICGAIYIRCEELVPWHRWDFIEALRYTMIEIYSTGPSYTSAEFKTLKESLRLNIGFFHLNFTLLSQNQRPNKPPIQSLIGLDSLTFRVVVMAALSPSS